MVVSSVTDQKCETHLEGRSLNVIDRRPNSRDKNLNNRQRFIQRTREQVKRAVADALKGGNVKETYDNGKIKVPVKGTKEPIFGHDYKSGNRQHVVPGNKDFIEGDTIQKPDEEDGAGRSGAMDGEGEDDFEFTLTKEEFLNFFFEDLELPDLIKKQIRDIDKFKQTRSGFTNYGSPVQLDVRMTMRYAIGRRIALRRPKPEDIEALEAEAQTLLAAGKVEAADALFAEIKALCNRMKAVPWIDPFDVRYRNFVMQPQPVTQAVMICVMDVSGSMAEREKDIAKRFFMLLYIFLTRKYQNVDIVYVRHHSSAEECNEEDFFYKRESGGTLVSSGLELANKIIRDRYPVNDWNIYVAQASDGDNYAGDNDDCRAELAKMLPIVQYFAYLDIPAEVATLFASSARNSDLWNLYFDIAKLYPNLAMKHASDQSQIWGVFAELFSKERKASA